MNLQNIIRKLKGQWLLRCSALLGVMSTNQSNDGQHECQPSNQTKRQKRPPKLSLLNHLLYHCSFDAAKRLMRQSLTQVSHISSTQLFPQPQLLCSYDN
jgi:hypothetical protein